MQIDLSTQLQDWLRSQVAAGAFANVEDAVAAAVRRLMLDDGIGDEDLAWAKPSIDSGLAELDKGKSFSHDEVFDHLESIVAARK